MFALHWIFIVGFHCYVLCYENLCRRPTTILTQSSTYNAQNASIANDGNVRTDDPHCAHTEANYAKAWLQVDFGESYKINNVKIYYRKDGNGAWKQYRFRQFYLDMSNSSATQTTTSERTRCYTDNTTYQYLPPNIIHILCKQTARYVIVETTYDAPEDGPTIGAILEICEIEVYGCETTCKNNVCDGSGNCTDGCKDGYWGPACNFQCPVNCKEHNCIIYSGHCNSCKSGYWGDICNSECPIHCIERICDKSSGSCTQGCTIGRYGDMCNSCSPGCVGGTCDEQSAICSYGCLQNWTGSHCDGCVSTHYGSSCSLECNYNCEDSTCNDTTGFCTFGCKTGFYGAECDRECSSCPSGCDQLAGRCHGDCPVGKFGSFCDKACNQGCKNGCMRDSGVCINCTVGMYGNVCDKYCSSCRTGCDRITGRCLGDRCTVGKLGDFCNETCDVRHVACCNQNTCTSHCKQLQMSKTENGPSLYVVIAVLCISLVVNICTITWILRNNACKRRDVNQEKKRKITDSISTPRIYDTTEDNAGYQELGQLSGPSHYDQLQGPATNK